MPANSGAITGTIAHKHSALSADGGFLDDGVTGVTGSANGSLLMFDGSSIAQDLPAGNLNDVLTMGAAVPAWTAAVGGGGLTLLVDSVTLGASNNTITSSFAAVNQSDVSQFFCVLNAEKDTAGGQINLTCNNLVLGYDYGMIQQNTAAPTGTFATARTQWDILFNNLGDKIFTKVDFLCNAVSGNIQGVATTVSQVDTAITRLYNTTLGQTSISEIEFTVSAGQWYAGSRLDVYRVDV